MRTPVDRDPHPASRHRRVAWLCAIIPTVMLGAAFAAVPLYDLFCRVTGYGGTTQVAAAGPGTVGERVFTVRFDANVSRDLGWRFEPEATSVEVRAGETKLIYYRVTNPHPWPTTGIASYNVTPGQAGIHFAKIQCFCFTDQTLGPGESLEMPVVFFIDTRAETDPSMAGLGTLTLSYSFFPARAAAPLAANGALSPPL